MSENEERLFSRREIASGLGAGLVAVAAAPAFAQVALPGATKTTDAATVPPLENPTTKYPKPPFKSQSQPWPGLASKMDPPPDHGETSYVGSGRAAGRQALIPGAD